MAIANPYSKSISSMFFTESGFDSISDTDIGELLKIIALENKEIDHLKLLNSIRDDIRHCDHSMILNKWNGRKHYVSPCYYITDFSNLSSGGIVSIEPHKSLIDKVVCEMIVIRDLIYKCTEIKIENLYYPPWMYRGFHNLFPIELKGFKNLISIFEAHLKANFGNKTWIRGSIDKKIKKIVITIDKNYYSSVCELINLANPIILTGVSNNLWYQMNTAKNFQGYAFSFIPSH